MTCFRPKRALTALACAAMLGPVAGTAQTLSDPVPQISLDAESQVSAKPDLATLNLGVEARAETAREAVDQLTAGLQGVMAAVTAAGVAEEDVQSSSLELSPVQPDYGASPRKPEAEGFVARSTVTVRVRDLSATGALLDTAVSGGANVFNGIRFEVADPSALLDQARRQAVAEARRQAALYAEAAGVELGRLISLTPHGMARPLMMRAEMASDAAAAPVPVAPGEVVYSAGVSMVYEIAAPDGGN